MRQEMLLIIETAIFLAVWTYLDYRYFKWCGMSPIWGSLKQEKPALKVRDFSFSLSAYFLIWSVVIFLYHKFMNKLVEDFSLKKAFVLISISLFFISLVTRVIVAYKVRREDDGQSLVINGAIAGVVLAIGLISIYIWNSF